MNVTNIKILGEEAVQAILEIIKNLKDQVEANEIDPSIFDPINASIAELQEALDDKADASALDDKADKSSVEAIQTALDDKADKSSVEAIQTALDDKADKSSVEAIQTALDDKADKSSVEAIESRNTAIDSTLSDLADDLDLSSPTAGTLEEFEINYVGEEAVQAILEIIKNLKDQVEANEIDPSIFDPINASIAELQEALDDKADASALDDKADKSSVEAIQTALDDKADKSSVEAIQTALDDKADASALDDKADKSSVEAIESRNTAVDSTLESVAGSIEADLTPEPAGEIEEYVINTIDEDAVVAMLEIMANMHQEIEQLKARVTALENA